MKVLVVGSEGFIGSNCCRHFRAQGHEVFGVDVAASNIQNFFSVQKNNSDFSSIFKSQSFDVCVNASGSANVNFSFENPTLDFELNVVNVHKLLVAIRTFNPECRFLNFSSAAVYGSPESLPTHESAKTAPLSPYGFHKLQSEYLLTEYHKFFSLRTCSLRVFSAYGPHLKKQLFWDIYLKSKNKKEIILYGTGEESRDFIFISDLMRAVDCVIQKNPFDGGVINIASGSETTIQSAATILLERLGYEGQLLFNREQKPGDPPNWRADISQLTSFGFTPQISVESGLKQYAQWLAEEK